MIFYGLIVLLSVSLINGAIVSNLGTIPSHITDFLRSVDWNGDRIVGGSIAGTNAYPFMARLISDYGNNEMNLCGGTLIDPRYVLTASHCLFNQEGRQPLQVYVFLGDNLLEQKEPHEVVMVTTQFQAHEFYTPIRNDIALILLPQPAPLSNYITTACIPSSFKQYENVYARAIGWGQTGTTEPASEQLKEVDIPIVPPTSCQNNYGYNSFDPNVMLCTDFKDQFNKQSVCMGDSGGPLFGLDNGQLTVLGLTSFGPRIGCAIQGAVFTKISAFTSWVLQNTPYAVSGICVN